MKHKRIVRESIGGIQGTVHSWYCAAEPPYFMLCESATRELIKCFYGETDYDAVVQAVKSKNQIIHIHGRIFSDTARRCIREVSVDRIVPADPMEPETVLALYRARGYTCVGFVLVNDANQDVVSAWYSGFPVERRQALLDSERAGNYRVEQL